MVFLGCVFWEGHEVQHFISSLDSYLYYQFSVAGKDYRNVDLCKNVLIVLITNDVRAGVLSPEDKFVF